LAKPTKEERARIREEWKAAERGREPTPVAGTAKAKPAKPQAPEDDALPAPDEPMVLVNARGDVAQSSSRQSNAGTDEAPLTPAERDARRAERQRRQIQVRIPLDARAPDDFERNYGKSALGVDPRTDPFMSALHGAGWPVTKR
jgi:hypothetical protein